MRVVLRRDSYTMKVDRERNYYNCKSFEYLAHHCHSRKVIEEDRRISFGNNDKNLKEEGNQSHN